MQIPLSQSSRPPQQRDGYTLMMVMVITGVGLLILASVLRWVTTSANLNDRNQEYFTAVFAAEASTEKIISRLSRDYTRGGEQNVAANFYAYTSLVPTASENSFWNNFEFTNPGGGAGVYIVRKNPRCYTSLSAAYAGLNGFASDYSIIANARNKNSRNKISGAVEQTVQLASIPIFQYAVFYDMDLEVNPGELMDVRGRVHSNGNIWNGGSGTLTFYNEVTSVGKITKTRHPQDPTGVGGTGSVNFKLPDQKKTGVDTLSLPISNLTNTIHSIIEVPPKGEVTTSEMGLQRYYNKAELLIIVKDTNVIIAAKNTYGGNVSNNIPWNQVTNFLSTNAVFTDQREGKTVKLTEIDVAKMGAWSKTNSVLNHATTGVLSGKLGKVGQPVNLVYVSDQRTTKSTEMTGVRLINGQTLPERGLTVATENPLYVQGHFNAPSGAVGTTNTSNTKPASLVSDALTVLSAKWDDAKSPLSYSLRKPEDTTVNAALLTGIVGTTNNPSRYSGGVQNIARYLEDWNGKTVTYNGSIVALFESKKSTARFKQPGESGAYYSIPVRNFNFDNNFTIEANIPPGTPELRTLIRAEWKNPPAKSTNYVQTYN
ncbi:MAG: hypothetical protein ABJC04_07375 [Verrucomicrobiota bacterium]